jgi:hypothetical protein
MQSCLEEVEVAEAATIEEEAQGTDQTSSQATRVAIPNQTISHRRNIGR